jgi:hypothetical protein
VVSSLGGYHNGGREGRIGVDIGQAWFVAIPESTILNNENGPYEATAISYLRHDASKGNGQATDRNAAMGTNSGLALIENIAADVRKPAVDKTKPVKPGKGPKIKKGKAVAAPVTPAVANDPFAEGYGENDYGSTSYSAGSAPQSPPPASTPYSAPSDPTPPSGGDSSNPFGGSY